MGPALWPLIITAGSTLGGVAITQVAAARSERRRIKQETLVREEAHDRRWDKELRLAYGTFLTAIGQATEEARAAQVGSRQTFDLNALGRASSDIEVIAPAEVSTAALEVMKKFAWIYLHVGSESAFGPFTDLEFTNALVDGLNPTIEKFRDAARVSLGLPPNSDQSVE